MLNNVFQNLARYVLACGLLAGCSSPAEPPPETVRHVDLQRYMGLWYEFARIPNRFQAKCVANTTARYTLREDGRVEVINRCQVTDGTYTTAQGIARVVDTQSNAKLDVSFVSLFGWPLFWGDYWIIGLAEDYRYVVIGTPDRKYGWILSRRPKLDATSLARIDSLLQAQGYSMAQFEMTQQHEAALVGALANINAVQQP